ncbi:MAG: DASS family sodium-coupled anion symporter [Bryobacterales bacterium]|nr:DASS family sodium-coupled anion symporter [Bryobacterales bacterium]
MPEPQPRSFTLTSQSQFTKLAAIALFYVVLVYVLPKPESVKPEGWRLLGIFLSIIAGLILQPIPGGAIVLIGVTLSAATKSITIAEALAGYADGSVWLVVAAFMISRSLINTGLARRIALFFVRLFGRSSLGVSYALAMSDVVLGAIIPSNAARSGGVVLPILRSITELYGSTPGPTAAMLGTFLYAAVYQSICISAAMFFTGQASNPLAASISTQAGFPITPVSWFMAGIVPGTVSLILAPLVARWMLPPVIRETPEAAEFARKELTAMGSLSLAEKIMAAVFLSVCVGWVTHRMHGIDITVVALLGSAVLLISGVLSWDDVKKETAMWDIFLWYGGLVCLGRELNKAGVTQAFAKGVASFFLDSSWVVLFAVALLVYFYAHYGFASITAHILAMYPPFLAVLTAKGAPIGLVAFSFATFVNFAAGLTNYGTTPSPMFFAHEYVTWKDWWRVGFLMSVINLTVWSTVGFLWWKLLGIW